jgi:uncharacterized protein (TIGR02145 family)
MRFVFVLISMIIVDFIELKGQLEVKIGKQVWMTKNLEVSTFRNGDTILEIKTKEDWERAEYDATPGWCYYENDSENGKKYGKLYNFFAVYDKRGLAPTGWHIPSDKEWMKLVDYLGGDYLAGKKLKDAYSWYPSQGNNLSGFSGLPGGVRFRKGMFFGIKDRAAFWSSTLSSNTSVWCWYLDLIEVFIDRGEDFVNSGFSVRCVKD